jgi:hypothetical protein
MSDKDHTGSVRTGEGDVGVGGNVTGNLTINNYTAPKDVGPDEDLLQRGYLQWREMADEEEFIANLGRTDPESMARGRAAGHRPQSELGLARG